MSNIITRSLGWLHAWPPAAKAAFQAALAIVLFALGAALENRVQLIFEDDPKQVVRGILWVAGLLVLAGFYGVLHYAYLWGRQQEENLRTAQRRAI